MPDTPTSTVASSSPDTKAAHEFLTELTTRIATQRLPYQDGDEQAALESLASLFPKGRAIIHTNPGCKVAKVAIEDVLNDILRPFTAKWHRQSIEGRLAGRDGADTFREELLAVQDKVRAFAGKLADIAAGGTGANPVELKWSDATPREEALAADMASVPCGIPAEKWPGQPSGNQPWFGTSMPADVNVEEAKAIRERRANVGASRQGGSSQPPQDAFGLAFSGGGIRSASFSLGVAQVLGEKGLLKEADYISTVSGGGYTGSFITRRLGQITGHVASADPSEDVIDRPNGPDTPAISYLRMRAGYLSGDGFKRRWLMACHMISGTLLNGLAPLFLLLLPAFLVSVVVLVFPVNKDKDPTRQAPEPPAAVQGTVTKTTTITTVTTMVATEGGVTTATNGVKREVVQSPADDKSYKGKQPDANWATLIHNIWSEFKGLDAAGRFRWINRVLILGLGLAGTLIYGMRLRHCATSREALNRMVEGTGVLFGVSVSLGLAFLLLDLLDGGMNDGAGGGLWAKGGWLRKLWEEGHAVFGSAAGAGSLAVVAHAMGNAKVRKAIAILGIVLAVLVVPLTAMVIERSMLELALNSDIGGPWISIIATVVVFVLLLVAVDINRTSPRPLYQERLARTFIKGNDDDDEVPLEKANPSGLAPIHILNAALNIPGTSAATMRERGCDFFSFTPFFCGAPTIGYDHTSQWKSHGRTITLDVAMAVSAAAASSRMGLFAVPGAAPLMTLLNVRLGYWMRKPWQASCLNVPGAVQLTSEMTKWRMEERKPWINLSDGGHIENMAAYELLRRRCKFILCVDGEADAGFGFAGLMTLVRHARIDLGIHMEPMLNELRPKEKGGPSRSHFAIWKIHYPAPKGHGPGPVGFFLYLKLSMTGNEPELIRTYQQKHPEFPHQSTADQFFDQEQFEAYRSLGAHVAEMLFQPALLRAPGDQGTPSSPADVKAFFTRIARNMLY